MIATGVYFSLYVDHELNCWATGEWKGLTNAARKVEMVPDLPPIQSVSAYYQSVLVDLHGGAWTCDLESRLLPIPNIPLMKSSAVGHKNSLLLSERGEVFVKADSNSCSTPKRIENIPPICGLASGFDVSLFLDEEGGVWGLGNSKNYCLGVSDNVTQPIRISNIPPMKAVSSGWNHSLFLDLDGNVWGCGSNFYGALPVDVNLLKTPQILEYPNKIKSISAFYHHSICVGDDGSVWECRKNNSHLGYPQKEHDRGPTLKKIPINNDVTSVASLYHSLFLDSSGGVWGCGKNDKNQLGFNSSSDYVATPQQIPDLPPIGRTFHVKSARNI